MEGATDLLRKECRWLPVLAPRLPLPVPTPVRIGQPSARFPGIAADVRAVRAVWDDAVSAPEWEGPRVWLHGDLHPANVVVSDGTLSGVIDFDARVDVTLPRGPAARRGQSTHRHDAGRTATTSVLAAVRSLSPEW